MPLLLALFCSRTSLSVSPTPEQNGAPRCRVITVAPPCLLTASQLHCSIPHTNSSAASTSTSPNPYYHTSCLGKAPFCLVATTPSPERRHALGSPRLAYTEAPLLSLSLVSSSPLTLVTHVGDRFTSTAVCLLERGSTPPCHCRCRDLHVVGVHHRLVGTLTHPS